jgi:hypothetical protein
MRPNRERLTVAAREAVRRIARRAGFDVVRSDFYSPVVDPTALPSEIWERQSPMAGLKLDLDAQLRMIEERLMPLMAEFQPPVHAPPGHADYFLENELYGPMDAHILYALVRQLRPRRVLELGSGYSTLVIEQALRRDAGGGREAIHEVIDPWPSPVLAAAGGLLQVHAQSGATAPAALFDSLDDGDILFVDTSHTVQPGGEVVRLVLEVLPALAPGVLVHFHDIYRPFEYPRVFYELFNVHWQEQYLLQAFLSFNPNFEVVCANHALWRLRRERVKAWFAGLREGMEPSGFWFRRR